MFFAEETIPRGGYAKEKISTLPIRSA